MLGAAQGRPGSGSHDPAVGKVLYIYNATSGALPTETVSFTLTVE